MAARTARSSMPRRRNCFSIISARCGARSLLSGMRDRLGVLFPPAGFQDFFHLIERKVALLLTIVKMRREANAGLGAVIDENVAREKFTANFISVRTFHRNRSGALRWILRRVDFPTARLCALDETQSHA